MRNNYCVLFIGILLLISCNNYNKVTSSSLIQKRKYTKGFFVNKIHQFKSKPQAQKHNKSSDDEIPVIQSPNAEENQNMSAFANNSMLTNHASELKNTRYSQPAPTKLHIPSLQSKYSPAIKSQVLKNDKKIIIEDEQKDHTNKTAVAAFILCLVANLFVFISISLIEYSVLYSILLFLTAGISGLISIILCIIALIQFSQNSQQKGRGFAIIPLVLFIIGLLLISSW